MDSVPEKTENDLFDSEQGSLKKTSTSIAIEQIGLQIPSTSKRVRKRRLDLNSCFSVSNFICNESYCGLTLPDEEKLDQHYKQHLDLEMGKLNKIRVKKKPLANIEVVEHRNIRNVALEKLKLRREERKIRRSLVAPCETIIGLSNCCPVCDASVEGTIEDLKEHFNACLRVRETNTVEEDFIEVDDEDYEEYEWAGQRRIRSTSMFKGGLKAAGFLTIKQTREDEVLDVIGDDEEEIGTAQYNDSDLLKIEDEVLDNSSDISITESQLQTGTLGVSSSCSVSSSCRFVGQDNNVICKICMSSYDSPLTSTTCWHVHCERCWLLALGEKKLCPQCKAIVTPGDLRKIFL